MEKEMPMTMTKRNNLQDDLARDGQLETEAGGGGGGHAEEVQDEQGGVQEDDDGQGEA